MRAEEMEEYVKFIGDQVLTDLGVPPIWRCKNPFPWMQMQGMEGKTNFFEKRVSAYQKAHSKKEFTLDLHAAFAEG
jgi:ribonucleotide reductase beta subunit family protein with ferritin-like domain